MSTTNNNIKPFYIYTDKNYLYMKNINAHTEKLYNNVYTYCANVDNNNKIHICCIDTTGKLIHIYNNNNSWKKKVVCKVFNNIKNVKNMRLYIVNNYLNIFVVEDNPLSEKTYRVSHFNFSPKNYKVYTFHINNILKDNSSIYKINIDSLSNFIFQYKPATINSDNSEENTLIFNSLSRAWLNSTNLPLSRVSNLDYSSSDIKNDIFDFCYSLTYKI